MGGPYKLKKRGKPMTTIYDAAILLVDDNPDLLTLVTDNLRTAGYKTVCTAADCAAARAAFAAHRPDLMILDINLPDGDGFGLFRTLRTESDVPALFLSARDADADRLFGLGLGADDYLTKPFLMQELLLRVQHLLQRAYRTELRRSRVLTLGDCTVNLQDAAVRRADGTIRLPTDGFAGELADTVNRTSEQLRRRNEIIARRDDARTSWIAGVSHDVRTPLALILGWAEQLEQDTALPAAARQKACGIRTQSEKLRALIEDLNLTSKLQYGAQPLRCQPTQAGPLLRRLAAEFCDSPLAASCTVALEIAPDADKAILDADAALLARAVENLLHNAACHNPGPVQVQLSAVRTGKTLRITIADDGAGYPPAVLHALQTGEAGENTPHILGLHVVEQIIHAHGGTAAFARNAPRGAKAVLVLPVTEDPAAR